MPDYSKKLGLPEDVRPVWTKDGQPTCAKHDRPLCPSFDGKRCTVVGFRPPWHCEPAITAMAKAIPGFLEGK